MFHQFSIEATARTKAGRRRAINQDVVSLRNDLALYILADGMGGHAAGELAAAIAVESMEAFYADSAATWPPDADGPASDPRAFLVAAIKHANFRIRQFAELNPEHRGMGAAVAALRVAGNGVCLAHLGHVRGYRFREGGLELLTADHTLLNSYLHHGAHRELAERLPYANANILARALGMRPRPDVAVRVEDARPGDIVALVSNGLYKVVSDPQMAQILSGRTPLESMAEALVTVAEAHGAADDVSCVLVRWSAEEQAPNLAA